MSCSKKMWYLKFKWPQQDSNPNHLVRKQTLSHLAKLVKWLSRVVSTYLYGAFDSSISERIYTIVTGISMNSVTVTYTPDQRRIET